MYACNYNASYFIADIETYRGLQTTATLITTIILITMPLFIFLVMAVYFPVASIKKLGYFKKPRKSADPEGAKNSKNIEMREHDIIVDQKLRENLKSTTV